MSDETYEPPRFRDGRGQPLVDPHAIWGLELRYVLCDLIASLDGAACTVAELVAALVGRGRYRMGSIPGTTRRRIRKVARHRTALSGELAARAGDRFT